MTRIASALLLAFLAADAGASSVFAQAGCQPTLTQPCAKPPARPSNNLPSQRAGAAKTNDANEPIDHSPRIKVDRDTDLKFGTGGIGLGRKF
jgi:hypothetical protein